MGQSEDLILVEKVQSGDREAFSGLYGRYKAKILNYLYRMFNNRTLAEDITQQAFIKAYLNISKYKPTGTFSSWLYAIARNLAKNEIRKISRIKIVSLDACISEDGQLSLLDVMKSGAFNVEKTLENKEIKEKIEDMLEIMPVKYREIITLCIIQDMSYEEVAKIIKCSVSTVAIRLHRARKHFIEMIKKTGQDQNEMSI